MIAQSCHASLLFAKEHSLIFKEWTEVSNYICVLDANIDKIYNIIEKAKIKNLNFSIFRESDMNDQITSIALEPGIISKKLCSNLKLALRK